MKKTILLLLIVLAIFSFASCKKDPPHEHTFSSTWAYDENYHWHESSCGHDVTAGNAPHNWDAGIVTTEPTHTTAGVRTYTCTICGAKKTEAVPANTEAHTFSTEWASDANYHWHAATCGHTTLKSGQSAHTWNNGVITTEPTHTEAGVKAYACTVCGQTKEEVVPANAEAHTFSTDWSSDADTHWHAATCVHTTLKSEQSAHTWNNGVVTTEPTHTEGGVKTYTCTVCGQTKEEVVPANAEAHTFSTDWSSDADTHWHAATCVHTTLKSQQSEHTWNAGVITTPATCTEAGVKTYTCTVCGRTRTESVPATGHAYDNGVITTPAGCTTTGVKTFTCETCGNTYTETVAALGHDYSELWTIDVAATCTENGSKSHHCSRCDSKSDVTGIPATGHSYNAGVVTTPAGCTTTGVKTYTCSTCGNTYTEDIPATGHAYSEDWTYDTYYHWHTATCEHTEEQGSKAVHNYGVGQAVEQNDGTYKFRYTCTDCGYSKVLNSATVGSIGPAGGIVFYDKGEYSDGWRFLETTPGEIHVVQDEIIVDPNHPLYNNNDAITSFIFGYGYAGSTSTDFGTGQVNTDRLVATMGSAAGTTSGGSATTTLYAAKLCADLVFNGYDDWFLPSGREVYSMLSSGCGIHNGGWSSSEYNDLQAYIFVSSGNSSRESRSKALPVRPVRVF